MPRAASSSDGSIRRSTACSGSSTYGKQNSVSASHAPQNPYRDGSRSIPSGPSRTPCSSPRGPSALTSRYAPM